MAENKLTIGGIMGVKLTAKQYESVDVSAVVTFEVSSDLSDEEIEKLEEKANNILRKQLAVKTKIAFDEYNQKLQRIKKEAGY